MRCETHNGRVWKQEVTEWRTSRSTNCCCLPINHTSSGHGTERDDCETAQVFPCVWGREGGGGQERERASILAGESEREEELLEKSLLINALALAKACPQTREVKGAMRNLARCT